MPKIRFSIDIREILRWGVLKAGVLVALSVFTQNESLLGEEWEWLLESNAGVPVQQFFLDSERKLPLSPFMKPETAGYYFNDNQVNPNWSVAPW